MNHQLTSLCNLDYCEKSQQKGFDNMGKEQSKVFFYKGSWYHRTKILRDDFTVSYSKKGGFSSEDEALESCDKMEAEFEAKRKALSVKNSSNITLLDYLTYWFYQVEVPKISSSTRMVWEIVFTDTLKPHITDMKLCHCTVEYYDELLEKAAAYSASAGNKAREFLYNAMKAAVNDGYLKNNPIENTKKYPRGNPNITILTKSELKKLISEICKTNWLFEIMLALFCGLRKGEILGLKWSDFDLDERTVKIQRQITQEYIFNEEGKRIGQKPSEKPPKTENSYRTLRVPSVIIAELINRKDRIDADKQKMGNKYIDNGYICCQKNGEPSSLSAINTALKKACIKSGVRQVSVHSLRHIYATVLLESGVPLAKISALLGHSSVHTTFEYYCEVIDERQNIKSYIDEEFTVEEKNHGG